MVSGERREKEALLGRTIAGKFHIESIVGEGAMGVVYKARQVALEKTVAIKVMHSDMASDELFVARFKREAKAASRLDHPNSMRVIDFGEDGGLLYIAMEYLDGTDLFKMIKAGWPLRNDRVVDIMMQALAALAVAHDMGVIHRDLKPENIMILAGKDDEGRQRDTVKVCDFGIAKMDSRASKDTGAKLSTKGLVVGTPEYMSPEQGKGESLDARSDLYSMGVILFQLLTGQLPFDAESALGIVLKHVTEEPPRPRDLYGGVDARLEAICIKGMRKKREERYQTAREMRADLKAMVEGATLSAPLPLSNSAPTSGPMESAATVRVPLAMPAMTPSPSKITPLGTEAFDRDPDNAAGVPRSGRLAATLILVPVIAAVLAGVYFGVVKPMRAAASPVATDAPTYTTPPAISLDPVYSDVPLAPLASVPTKKPVTGVAVPKPSASVASSSSGAPNVAALDASTTGAVAALDAGTTGVVDDTDNARVGVRVVNVDHTTHQAMFAAVSAGDPTRCYQTALKGGAKPVDAKATLHVDVDATGHVATAGLNGTNFPAAAGSCILQSMNRREVKGVTEPATADVELHFLPK